MTMGYNCFSRWFIFFLVMDGSQCGWFSVQRCSWKKRGGCTTGFTIDRACMCTMVSTFGHGTIVSPDGSNLIVHAWMVQHPSEHTIGTTVVQQGQGLLFPHGTTKEHPQVSAQYNRTMPAMLTMRAASSCKQGTAPHLTKAQKRNQTAKNAALDILAGDSITHTRITTYQRPGSSGGSNNALKHPSITPSLHLPSTTPPLHHYIPHHSSPFLHPASLHHSIHHHHYTITPTLVPELASGNFS